MSRKSTLMKHESKVIKSMSLIFGPYLILLIPVMIFTEDFNFLQVLFLLIGTGLVYVIGQPRKTRYAFLRGDCIIKCTDSSKNKK